MRPSLNLDFANTKQLDPRVTFSRASKGTYYGADGIMRIAQAGVPRFDHDPVTLESKGLLIEGAATNLLSYSENFDNAVWTKSNCTVVPNAAIAPDGTMTADKIAETTSKSAHYFIQTSSVVTGTSYSLHFYVKFGGRNVITAQFVNMFAQNFVEFNLATGTLGNKLGATGTIVPLSNDWYRCSIMATATATGVTTCVMYLTDNAATTYTGDGISGLYIWGANLTQGELSSYIPSIDTFTSRASTAMVTGPDGLLRLAAVNEARWNYNPANLTLAPKLLLEGASTNLLVYSEQFDSVAWEKYAGSSLAVNSAVAPDGNQTADVLTLVSGSALRYSGISITNGTTTSTSLFVKKGVSGSATKLRITSNNTLAWNTGKSTVITLTDQWQRIVADTTLTVANTVMNLVIGAITEANATDEECLGTVQIWGAQLEAGPLSSYIPTTTTALTRSADVSTSSAATRAPDIARMTGKNFSDWWNPVEGTFVSAFRSSNPSGAGYDCVYQADSGMASNLISLLKNNGASSLFYATSVVSGVGKEYIYTGAIAANTLTTVAHGYKANDFAASHAGGAVGTDTLGTVSNSLNRICLGGDGTGNSLNGHIARITYYPKRLDNATLQALSAN